MKNDSLTDCEGGPPPAPPWYSLYQRNVSLTLFLSFFLPGHFETHKNACASDAKNNCHSFPVAESWQRSCQPADCANCFSGQCTCPTSFSPKVSLVLKIKGRNLMKCLTSGGQTGGYNGPCLSLGSHYLQARCGVNLVFTKWPSPRSQLVKGEGCMMHIILTEETGFWKTVLGLTHRQVRTTTETPLTIVGDGLIGQMLSAMGMKENMQGITVSAMTSP